MSPLSKVYGAINPTKTVINPWILTFKKGQNNFAESFYTFALQQASEVWPGTKCELCTFK